MGHIWETGINFLLATNLEGKLRIYLSCSEKCIVATYSVLKGD